MSRTNPRKPEPPPEDVLAYTQNLLKPGTSDNIISMSENGSAPPAPIPKATLTTEVAPSVDQGGNLVPWVATVDAANLLKMDIPRPAPLINGLLCAGEKILVTAASKSLKTYTSFDTAISVATGEDFWGMGTTAGIVLFANFEIPEYGVQDRIRQVCQKKGIRKFPEGRLHMLNLRGSRFEIDRLTKQLQYSVERIKGSIGLIIVDPTYKAMPRGMSENGDETIREFTNYLDEVAETTGAAVLYTHHHPKGSMAERSMIDRGSGSGVWARDADVIVDMIRHEEEDHYVVSNVQRSRASLDDFVVRVDFPLFVRAEDLDPADVKKPGGGKKGSQYNAQMLLGAFDEPGQGLRFGEWFGKVQAAEGMARQTFNNLRSDLLKEGKIAFCEGSKLYALAPCRKQSSPALDH